MNISYKSMLEASLIWRLAKCFDDTDMLSDEEKRWLLDEMNKLIDKQEV